MAHYIYTKLLVLLLAMLSFITEAQVDPVFGNERTKWAVLIAGSNTYGNYRHQADVCHAYQVLKKGGFKDENIIVFMYDDIAYNVDNPRPGVIINKPNGEDVYAGVPKDYTGDDVNVANFFAVILGNKTALTGGSGKVVDSSPDDHIFIYYADHGSPGILGMPGYEEELYAKDLIDVLKKKHASKSYRRMVIYVEACEAGSMFEGLLPENLNIYVTTASNATEGSWATYCSEQYPDVAAEAGNVCLGDTYSIAWIEDSEIHDLRKESLEEQYQAVRRRTAYEGLLECTDCHSNVMQYGTKEISTDFLDSYIGSNPANNDNSNLYPHHFTTSSSSIPKQMVSQRDADIFHLSHKIQQAPEGSKRRVEAQKQLNAAISKRQNEDKNMKSIAMRLFGFKNSLEELQTSARPQGQPLVDDWDCFKSLVRIYQEKCGTLSRYGRKYTRAIANMCNAKINAEQMAMASEQVCGKSTYLMTSKMF